MKSGEFETGVPGYLKRRHSDSGVSGLTKEGIQMSLRKKLIGDKAFYKMVLAVAVPMMIQNGITNFVGLLDNIMVGQIGTEQMSGIAIINQLMFVFNLAIFGAVSGAGIFCAQFFGCGDIKGVRHAFRYKMYICLAIVLIGGFVLAAFGDELTMLYLHGEENGPALQATLGYARDYLKVILWGILPFGLESVYTSTLREGGETYVSMKAGIVAVFVNLILNYLLIFGKLGFPEMGVVGAAWATVLSRYVQMLIVIVWTHRHVEKMPFIRNIYKSFKIPGALAWKITLKGTPLMINEVLWAAGMAILMQCYSLRGLDTVAGMNISSTITNLFNVVFIAMGSAIAIIVGQLLGAGKMEEARDTDTKLIAFSVFSCLIMGGLLVLTAPLFPLFYNTTENVRYLATVFIRIGAAYMPLHAFMHAAYFTMRCGGKTIITFLFDSAYMWCISIPVAYELSRYTGLPIIPLYFACQMIDIIKCIVGAVLLKKGIWMNNIVAKE